MKIEHEHVTCVHKPHFVCIPREHTHANKQKLVV